MTRHSPVPHVLETHTRRARLSSRSLTPAEIEQLPRTSAGSTPHVTVWYADVLGQAGATIAQGVLQHCEQDYQQLASWFGLNTGQLAAILAPFEDPADGTGGAFHDDCGVTDLYCDVQLNPPDPTVTQALFVAEAVEVFSAVQGQGWDCGASNGEGLSRVLAEEIYPQVLDAYTSASRWLDGGRPDWVNNTLATDRNAAANGCAVLFLFWLRYVQQKPWDAICQAAAPTLAGTYANLGLAGDAFGDFSNELANMFPLGQPSNLDHDNPFPVQAAIVSPGHGAGFITSPRVPGQEPLPRPPQPGT
jgi:hypothetical protein